MNQAPVILKRTIVAKGRIFTIEQLHLRFSNGEERIFERLVNPARTVVLIVPFLNKDTLLLVNEYAAGMERYELGFPKGIVEEGEDVLVAANREIQEEVGYGAKDLKVLASLTTSPGYWGSTSKIVLAQDLYKSSLPGDEPEPLEVVPWRLSDYKALLKREDFTEARSIAALLMLKEMLD